MPKKRDYKKTSHQIPRGFVPKPSKNREGREKLPRLFLFTIILFGFLIISSWMLTGKLFNIKNIIIVNTNSQTILNKQEIKNSVENQLSKNRFFLFKQNNFFSFSKRKARKRISEEFGIHDIDINKRFPVVIVNITGKDMRAIWSHDQKYFSLNTDGKISGIIKRDDQRKFYFPIIQDKINSKILIHQKVVDNNYTSYTIELKKIFDKHIAEPNLKIDYFIFHGHGSDDISIMTNEGWNIHLDHNNNPIQSLQILNLALKEKIKDRVNLEYIDLRLTDKIFYK